MKKKILITAAFFGLTAIILGAFGAHALKKLLTPESLASFEIGVRYQMYHALFLLFLGSTDAISDRIKQQAFFSIILGVIFFSGSIYLLSTEAITSINIRSFALITPLGGLLLMLGWVFLLLGIFRKQ